MASNLLVASFRKASTGQLFTALTLALCVVLIFVRFLLGDADFVKVLASVIEAVIATMLSALGIGLFLKVFSPREVGEEVDLVEPRNMRGVFNSNLENTEAWKYKGNFGRYFRTSVLPRLARRANDRHRSIAVSCMIIDPRNVDLCALHAHARNAAKTVDGKQNWTAQDVMVQVYATIVCCFVYRANLDVSLGLLGYFEPQRIDISSLGAIVTREDRLAPALKFNPAGYFYSAVVRDYQAAFEQSHRIDVPRNDFRIDTLNADAVVSIVRLAELDEGFASKNAESILGVVIGADNPYE